MRIIEAQDYKDMSRKAANVISAQMILKAVISHRISNRIYSDRSLRSIDRMV